MADNNKGPRINERIRVREVRLIDDEGNQLAPQWKLSEWLKSGTSTLLKSLQLQIRLYAKYSISENTALNRRKNSVTPRKSKRY